MSRHHTSEFQSFSEAEAGAMMASMIGGSITIDHINRGIIGNEYTNSDNDIYIKESRLNILKEAQPQMATEQGKRDLDVVIAHKEADIQSLAEVRDTHHPPYGIGTEFLTDGGLIVLSVLAVNGIRRLMHKHRQPKRAKAEPEFVGMN